MREVKDYLIDNIKIIKIMMKQVMKTIVAFVLLAAISVPLQAQDTLKLTLKEALDIALSDNLSVKVADMEVKRTGYAKKGTYAALFPQIDFSANYQGAIKKQVMVMGEQSFEIGKDHTWSTGFSLGMPLVSATLWKSIQITAIDVELAVEKARSSRQELIDQVQQTFYTTLLANDSYLVYKENYENALSDYNDVKEKYENGRVAKYDLIRADVALQNAKPSMYDAKNNIELCLWKLKALLGVDLDMSIACVGSLADYSDQMREVALNSEVSLTENSTMKQLELQDEMLHKTYQMQLAKYYPSLNLSLSYQWIAMEDNLKLKDYAWNPYSVAGLSITIPIFSGGQRFHSVKQTKVQREQLQLQKENTARELEVAVRQSLSSMDTYVKQFEAAEKNIEGAETGYDIAQKRYDVGSGTLLELQDSQLALLQARLNLNQSVYNYLVAKSSLDKILGVTGNNVVENK